MCIVVSLVIEFKKRGTPDRTCKMQFCAAMTESITPHVFAESNTNVSRCTNRFSTHVR